MYLGVSARVQRGNLVCGGNSQSVQSKQGVSPGMITRACPLRPSVPPSTMTLKLEGSGLPLSSYSAAPKISSEFLHQSTPSYNHTVPLQLARPALQASASSACCAADQLAGCWMTILPGTRGCHNCNGCLDPGPSALLRCQLTKCPSAQGWEYHNYSRNKNIAWGAA